MPNTERKVVKGFNLRVGDIVVEWRKAEVDADWEKVEKEAQVPIVKIRNTEAMFAERVGIRTGWVASAEYKYRIDRYVFDTTCFLIDGSEIRVGDVLLKWRVKDDSRWHLIATAQQKIVRIEVNGAMYAGTSIGWCRKADFIYEIKERAIVDKIEPVLTPEFLEDLLSAEAKMANSDCYRLWGRKELPLTPEERTAWSTTLRIKLEASAEKDRLNSMVRCDLEFEEWE